MQGATRWQDLLFNKLSDHIKLVGPTIRCASCTHSQPCWLLLPLSTRRCHPKASAAATSEACLLPPPPPCCACSCEGSPWQGDAQGKWRTNPHVQSYVLATDKVGGCVGLGAWAGGRAGGWVGGWVHASAQLS